MKRQRGYAIIPMEDVVDKYKELQPLGQFFSPSTIAFFHSGLPKQAYYVEGLSAYFVTGERQLGHGRRYTVRKLDWRSGEIDTIGPFNVFYRAEARKLAQKTAEDEALALGAQ